MNIKIDALYRERFDFRHNSPSLSEVSEMMRVVGVDSMEELIDQTIPASIRFEKELNLLPA